MGGREAGSKAGDIEGDPLCHTKKVDLTQLTMCNLQEFGMEQHDEISWSQCDR